MPSISTLLRGPLVVSVLSSILVLFYRWPVYFPSVQLDLPLVLVALPSGSLCSHPELPSRQGPPYCNDPLRGVLGTICPLNDCEAECQADPWCRRQRSRYRLLEPTITSDGVLRVGVVGPSRQSVVTGKLGCNDELFGVIRGPAILPLDFVPASSPLVAVGEECHYSAVARLIVGGRYLMSVSVERLADHASLEPEVSLPDRKMVCSELSEHPSRVASLEMFWPLNATSAYLGAEVLPRLSLIDVNVPPLVGCGRLSEAEPQWLHYTVVADVVKICGVDVEEYDLSDNYIWFSPNRSPAFLKSDERLKALGDRKVLFIGDSTVEDIWRLWSSKHLNAVYEKVWGTYEFMYSSESNPFMCGEETMLAGGWRSVKAVADRVAEVEPAVVILGENLHTLKKVGLASYRSLLRKLFGAVRGACSNCVLVFKPTTQPSGRRCGCSEDMEVSRCAFDLFYGRERLRRANEMASEIGREFGVVTVDDIYKVSLARPELSRDGIHWSKSFFPCPEEEGCSAAACEDYAAGNWQPEPLGAAVSNRSTSVNPAASRRKNFYRDLYPESVLARPNATLAPWFEGYHQPQTVADAAATGQPKSSHYEKNKSQEGALEGFPPVQANIQEPYHRSHTAVENDFISILSGTNFDESPPPPRPATPTDVEAVASQAAAMIEEVLAGGGGDAKGLIGELVQNSDTLCALLGELERPAQTAQANPWSTPQVTEHCFCKLLITHKQAGAIIGKNGAEIAAMEKAAHVTAKVSPGGSYFPGTTDRIMVLSGKGHSIRAALHEVVNKFDYCNQVAQAQEDAKSTFLGATNVVSRPRPLPMVLRMVVPNSSVGTLMGKQGRDIRQLAITCGVHIQISPRLTGVLERVVNITGASHQCMLAGCSIVEVIRHNPHVIEHSNVLIYTPYQHRLAAKQAESFRDYHMAANNDSPRESPFDPSPFASTAADGDALSRRGLMSKLLAKKREESPPIVREARSVNENLPPHIAAEERLRCHVRSEIQTNLVKEARVRAARLEKELGPSLLGLGPRAEINLMVQAANSRVTDEDQQHTYSGGGPLARETAELYRRLCGEDDGGRVCGVPEVMMTNDTATAITVAVPAVTSGGGGSSSSSNISPDRSSAGDGKPKKGEFADSTCSESSMRFLAAAGIPVPLPAVNEQAAGHHQDAAESAGSDDNYDDPIVLTELAPSLEGPKLFASISHLIDPCGYRIIALMPPPSLQLKSLSTESLLAPDSEEEEEEATDLKPRNDSSIDWRKTSTISTIGSLSGLNGSESLLEALAGLQAAVERSNDLTATQLQPAARRSSVVSPLAAATAEQKAEILIEKYRERLDAENEIGVTAALIAGFSLSMLTAVDPKIFEVSPLLYIYVLLLSFVGGFNMLNVIISSFVYFTGHRILSKTRKGPRDNARDFVAFWDNGTYAFLRRLSRDYFVLSIPMFLFAVGVQLVAVMPLPLGATAFIVLFLLGALGFKCSNLLQESMGAKPLRAATVESAQVVLYFLRKLAARYGLAQQVAEEELGIHQTLRSSWSFTKKEL
ncbi:Poly [ADP-ribose] polymerase 2 [Perkinsus chesapeaki]|uniref:Poly [ADP-ribose] polymerase 2 n=1 Tax=Perkinsus chesapeaki TaxID=330153 RepID=A0A7J6MS34_PERCH|nr:Poly [ADP-ribose] polymerase 2 [Perkinsus chesapeaki]